MRYALILFFALALSQQVIGADNSLYVFYPTDIRPIKMQKHILRYCPEITITVFSKIIDFEEQTRQTPPAAILSYAPVIKKNKHYTSVIKGLKDGRSEEDFVLVSIDKTVNISQISSIKIGVLDILGRKSMKTFVNKKLGEKVKIARVTKTEDILNLLTFNLVDAILISQHSLDKLRTQSNLNLVATQFNVQMDLAMLAVKNDNSKQLFLDCFNRLSKRTNDLLGVDQWVGVNQQSYILSGGGLWALK